jgi:hypothetical protein
MAKKREINFRCNDCERGFTNEAAWIYHGSQTGHNINGDNPSAEFRALQEEKRQLEEAYQLQGEKLSEVNGELNRARHKLTSIIAVVQL